MEENSVEHESVQSLVNKLVSNILQNSTHRFQKHQDEKGLHQRLKHKFFQFILEFPPFPSECEENNDISNEVRLT